MRRRQKAFTLIEVMVAVTILAFTATAAIKLVLMAQNSLEDVKRQRELLDAARAIQVEVRVGKLDKSGTSGDFSWETADKQREMMGDEFGKLNLGVSGDGGQNLGSLNWRELTVKNSRNDQQIVLLLPQEQKEQQGNNASDDLNTVSDDKSSNDKQSKS
jgi:prepilin-type N-terminal cleavage/methylation domain-containing protein